MFDKEKMITVSGTLKEFEWSNPHSWLHIVAVDPATGRNVEWAFEMGSVSVIAAQGIFDAEVVRRLLTRFRAGDKQAGDKVWLLLAFQMWRARWMSH